MLIAQSIQRVLEKGLNNQLVFTKRVTQAKRHVKHLREIKVIKRFMACILRLQDRAVTGRIIAVGSIVAFVNKCA